ncbi:MAG: hypothetical protein ACN2B6_03510 [Rickettsiales bacterium]
MGSTSTGKVTPSTATDATNVANSWNIPANVLIDDGIYTSADSTLTTTNTSNLWLGGFGFNIPDEATNLTAKLYINGYVDQPDCLWGALTVVFPGVGLISFGQSSVTTQGPPEGNDEINITEFFGEKNIPTNINDPNFQVVFLGTAESAIIAEFSVDLIQMEWFYDLPDPPVGGFGARNMVAGKASSAEAGGGGGEIGGGKKLL